MAAHQILLTSASLEPLDSNTYNVIDTPYPEGEISAANQWYNALMGKVHVE